MKWILLVIAILNVLEGIKVLIEGTPAPFLKYELNGFTHGAFHLLVGALLCYLCYHDSILATSLFRYIFVGLGLLAVAYGFVVFKSKQNAEKFGRSISYPVHASYYFGTGLVLILTVFY